MKVCYFGIYNPNYARNRQFIKGLRENGVEVIECRVEPTEKYKYWQLFRKHRQIQNYDLMIVGFRGQAVMPLAKLICRRPIVFDALTSLYDSNIVDRKSYPRYSLSAFKYWFLDWLSCRLADIVLFESNNSIKYFVKTFKIKKEKFKRMFIGSDDTLFYPRNYKKNIDQFLVHFHGRYVPQQGVEYIIKAAKILEGKNIKFNLIGNGPTYKMAISLSRELNTKNINFIDFMPPKELVKYMARADVCLGIFSKAPRAERPISIKIYETIAMKKALITANTPAIREILKDREDCLLCDIADSHDLAKKILELKNNPELRNKIAENGYKLFREKMTPKILGRELKDILEELLPKSLKHDN